MRNKMKTTTWVKELWLSLEQIYKEDEAELIKMILEDKTDDIKRQVKKCKSIEEFE